MTLTAFRTLYDYNDWANERLCAMLNSAFGKETNLREHPDAAIRAIQEAAAHIIAAQAVWRVRLQGTTSKPPLDAADYTTPLALRFAFGAERARFRSWLETLENDADLQREIAYATSQGTPYVQTSEQILMHLITHDMYHRGQITARLIDIGREDAVVSTDLIVFYRDV